MQQTKTRFISSASSKAPKLELTWGSMVKMLKKVLVEGLGEFNATSIKYYKEKEELAFIVADPTPFVINMVVKAKEHSDSKINREFRVKKTTHNAVIVHAKEDLTGVAETGCKLSIPSLGWNITYDDIEDSGTAVFNSGTSYFKIKDHKPKDPSFPNNAAKWANVCIARHFDRSGMAINGREVPKGWNKDDGSAPYGVSKWFYGYHDQGNNYGTERNVISNLADYPCRYVVIGDKDTFYLLTTPFGKNSGGYVVYGVGKVMDLVRDDDCVLITSYSRNGVFGTGSNDYRYYSLYNSFLPHTSIERSIFSLYDQNGTEVFDYNELRGSIHSDIISSSEWLSSENIVPTSAYSGKFYLEEYRLTSTWPVTGIKGYLRGFYWPVAMRSLIYGDLFIDDMFMFRTAHPNDNKYSLYPFAIDLRDWD